MAGRLVVVAGTGTDIGKTHVSEALVLAWRRHAPRVAGLKPIESGVPETGPSDATRLHTASSFHVKRFGHALRSGVSPHLAARQEGVVIDIADLARQIHSVREEADGIVVELPGGLFTPLTDDAFNADFARLLSPDVLVLVVPDRLGVLHDAVAASRAAAACATRLDGIVVVSPPRGDASTGTNAAEISRFTGLPVFATVPRASSAEIARHPGLQAILRTAAAGC